jgi:glycosyltransferase involved in cell wall biosynthesis
MSIVYVVAQQNSGTILERIAREIQQVSGGDIIYFPCPIPQADTYVVTHYSLLPHIVMPGRRVVCFFTHESVPIDASILNQCAWIICENEFNKLLLKSKGVDESKLVYIPECGDSEIFRPHDRKEDGAILVCGTNYPDKRKNPGMIHAVSKLLPNRKFILLGEGWKNGFGSNTEVLERVYLSYPEVHDRCSVYLSCSKLEGGGPNSLIESMHSNLIPVVSDTGNARDYIVHGFNGYIFPLDSKPEYVVGLIERAYEFDHKKKFPFVDVFQTVTHLTWHNYGVQWSEYLSPNQTSEI